jgi:hypothetical protein
MLLTADTNFCVQQRLQQQKITLQLKCGDLLIFKGDLVHSGGGSDVDNFRFFSYCPTKLTPPEWWNKHRDGLCLPASTKITEGVVTRNNLRVVTNPASCNFSHHAYRKYLFCNKTNEFFKFDMKAFFLGIHTHDASDSVAYNGEFVKLKNFDHCTKDASKHCIHFPSNHQLLDDFPDMLDSNVAHWRTKCECSVKRRSFNELQKQEAKLKRQRNS